MLEKNSELEGSKSMGRILRLRMGINPNSSGYGVVWGAYFFLPQVVVSALVTVIMQTRLSKALREYIEDKDAVKRKWHLMVPLLWGLAWIGFFAMWLDLVMDELSDSYLLPAISFLAILFIAYLAWRYKEHPLLRKATLASAAFSLIFGIVLCIILMLIGGANLDLPGWIVWIAYPFLLPQALVYTAVAARLGLGISRLIVIAVYLVVGLVLLIVLIPDVTIILRKSSDFNAVGVLFFLWGWGVPPLLTILSLHRLKSKRSENTQDPI